MAASTVREVSGERVFVVGDVHGCPEEPALLVAHLESREGLSERDLVIFLGDYIDRGPASRAVIELMIDVKRRHPGACFLKGNHEDMFLDFLGFGGRMGQAFLYNGGLETIQSYGISVFAPPEEMVKSFPEEHFKFLCGLDSILVVNDFICAHAGLNPLRELTAQNDGDVFWIRDEFIASVHSFDATVVFGHTPHKEIFAHLPYKIGIDTGLVFGNKLSCIELTSGKVFQVANGSKEVDVSRLDLSVPVG